MRVSIRIHTLRHGTDPLPGSTQTHTYVNTPTRTCHHQNKHDPNTSVGASLLILLYQLSSLTVTALGLEEDEAGGGSPRFVSHDEHPNAAVRLWGLGVVVSVVHRRRRAGRLS